MAGFPLPRLTDVLQSGDHFVSAWLPGETPIEARPSAAVP
jgi:hypothetical protein